MNGTPKTLRLAIFSAFEDKGQIVPHDLMIQIEARLKEYLAHKFQLYRSPVDGFGAITDANVDEKICELWFKIFGEKLQ
jgi:hypothetical protein